MDSSRFGDVTADPSAEARPIRVLVADDVDEIRELFATTLARQPGFDVVGTADDGIQAHAGARELRPDAILLDLAMPNRDGLEALPELRDHFPETVVVAISGFDSARMQRRALERGADAYVEKGTSVADIAELIRDLVAGRRAAAA